MMLVIPPSRTRIMLGMTVSEAMALAEFLKRLGCADCARFAAPRVTYDGVPEADTIWSAALSLQRALADAGFAPR